MDFTNSTFKRNARNCVRKCNSLQQVTSDTRISHETKIQSPFLFSTETEGKNMKNPVTTVSTWSKALLWTRRANELCHAAARVLEGLLMKSGGKSVVWIEFGRFGKL